MLPSLQQYLPFTVLKLLFTITFFCHFILVATVPTVYGIETVVAAATTTQTVMLVATVPTVYGIETPSTSDVEHVDVTGCNSTYRLRY